MFTGYYSEVVAVDVDPLGDDPALATMSFPVGTVWVVSEPPPVGDNVGLNGALTGVDVGVVVLPTTTTFTGVGDGPGTVAAGTFLTIPVLKIGTLILAFCAGLWSASNPFEGSETIVVFTGTFSATGAVLTGNCFLVNRYTKKATTAIKIPMIMYEVLLFINPD